MIHCGLRCRATSGVVPQTGPTASDDDDDDDLRRLLAAVNDAARILLGALAGAPDTPLSYDELEELSGCEPGRRSVALDQCTKLTFRPRLRNEGTAGRAAVTSTR